MCRGGGHDSISFSVRASSFPMCYVGAWLFSMLCFFVVVSDLQYNANANYIVIPIISHFNCMCKG